MNKIAENLFDSIDIIVDKKIKNTQFDRTLRGRIEKVASTSRGEYLISYQGNIFSAFSIGGTRYSIGEQIYFLVPDNSMQNDKYIIGSINGTALGASIESNVPSTDESGGGSSSSGGVGGGVSFTFDEDTGILHITTT